MKRTKTSSSTVLERALAKRLEFEEKYADQVAEEKRVTDARFVKGILPTLGDVGVIATTHEDSDMTLAPGESIGWELHEGVTQMFTVIRGRGTFLRGTPRDATASARDRARVALVHEGSVWSVDPGTYHDVTAAADDTLLPLRLLTMYTPPEH
jgi:mannose-6-phosphate isomerase-like protein (cupin superfamily)